ncbi:MAG: hypothetical protein ACKVOU_09110 [Cytophagales bacterium]
MYNIRPNLNIGFHGCDEKVRDSLVNDPGSIQLSKNPYDWLGHGFYVWENNYERAFQWAKDKKEIAHPSVVGVLFVLNNCLDFTDSKYIDVIDNYYNLFKFDINESNLTLPKNKDVREDSYKDKLMRKLDCAVIEYLHQKNQENIDSEIKLKGYSESKHFDTTRGIFTEGGPAFEGAGIQKKNHIQICIRNPNCIKGFFIPREEVKNQF